jgi:ankyrin repeat protein
MNAALVHSCEGGHVDIVKMLVQIPEHACDVFDEGALIAACKRGHVDMVRFLLEEMNRIMPGADIQNGEALFSACKGGHKEIVDLLVRAWHAP